jgi:hypothetical protein
LNRAPDDPLHVDPVAIIFNGHNFAIDDIAFFAAEPQNVERSAVAAIHVGQITGNEKTNPLALAARHPSPCLKSRLP